MGSFGKTTSKEKNLCKCTFQEIYLRMLLFILFTPYCSTFCYYLDLLTIVQVLDITFFALHQGFGMQFFLHKHT